MQRLSQLVLNLSLRPTVECLAAALAVLPTEINAGHPSSVRSPRDAAFTASATRCHRPTSSCGRFAVMRSMPDDPARHEATTVRHQVLLRSSYRPRCGRPPEFLPTLTAACAVPRSRAAATAPWTGPSCARRRAHLAEACYPRSDTGHRSGPRPLRRAASRSINYPRPYELPKCLHGHAAGLSQTHPRDLALVHQLVHLAAADAKSLGGFDWPIEQGLHLRQSRVTLSSELPKCLHGHATNLSQPHPGDLAAVDQLVQLARADPKNLGRFGWPIQQGLYARATLSRPSFPALWSGTHVSLLRRVQRSRPKAA